VIWQRPAGGQHFWTWTLLNYEEDKYAFFVADPLARGRDQDPHATMLEAVTTQTSLKDYRYHSHLFSTCNVYDSYKVSVDDAKRLLNLNAEKLKWKEPGSCSVDCLITSMVGVDILKMITTTGCFLRKEPTVIEVTCLNLTLTLTLTLNLIP